MTDPPQRGAGAAVDSALARIRSALQMCVERGYIRPEQEREVLGRVQEQFGQQAITDRVVRMAESFELLAEFGPEDLELGGEIEFTAANPELVKKLGKI